MLMSDMKIQRIQSVTCSGVFFFSVVIWLIRERNQCTLASHLLTCMAFDVDFATVWHGFLPPQPFMIE